MGSRSFGIVAGLLLVLVTMAGAVYAYDLATEPRIPHGTKVAGVPVGGLTKDEARERLRGPFSGWVARPLQIRLGRREFSVRASRLAAQVDVDATLERALAPAQRGSILERTLRRLRGDTRRANLAPSTTYSPQAVRALARRLARRITRPPRDTRIRVVDGRLRRVPARHGLAVRHATLSRRVESTLGSLDPRVAVPLRRSRPHVTGPELIRRYPNYIVVDRDGFTLRLYRRLRLAESYPIAVGQQGLETPAGLYDVQNKQINPTWTVPNSDWAGALAGRSIPPGPDNPLKARWLGFDGSAGIHGTEDIGSLGTAASHGCIRMAVPGVVDLYRHVDVGTPVYIS